MLALKKTNTITIFLLIFILINLTKNYESLEEKYYFQLYPSESKEKPFLFHAYTPDARFITINSTEGENCKILENRIVNEYPIKDLSSVILYNKTFLIKTCFGPDTIVEITDEKNETFSYKNNNIGTEEKTIDKLKYCYSTAIYNPLNKRQYVIMTYWTDYIIEKGREKYIHKCIIFNPNLKTFTQEIVLAGNSNIIERLVNNNYYARSCITFRSTDIYCSINLDSDTSYGNSFIIDTSKIYLSDPQIHLIFSNTDFGENVYQKPIAIGKEIHDIFGGFFDAFLTEYHHEEKDKIMLVSSLFRKSLHGSFISVSDSSKKYYGINVEDSDVDQNLFNHLLPNENDLIIIYTMKTRDGMGLVLTRFNLTNSITYHRSFKEYSLSNYLRDDICSKPKHIQSIFVNSFINYNERDKALIEFAGKEKYYKYQKDIVTLIACEDENKNVFYESKKIIMPQCLNILDEINNNDYHYIKYKENNNVTLDIYNDPNLLSLRNVTIEFLPIDVKGDPIIIMVKTAKTNYTYINHTKTNIVVNPTHIRIFITINFRTKVGLALPYRIKQTSYMESAITCHLSSDICKFELIKIKDDECNIDYCIYCDQNICKKCKTSIEGILLDNENNRCVCDINNGFQLYPQIFYSIFEMCVCKDDYSFYKNTSLCRPNSELNNGSYYEDRKDDVSLIPIYDDCPKDCENCEVKNKTGDKTIFTCPNGKENTDTIETHQLVTDKINIDNFTFVPSGVDICIDEKHLDDFIWFEYSEHKFYYAKIEQCIYIIFNNSLFFYSNKDDCLFTNNANIPYIPYISKCLNIFTFTNYEEYKLFIENSKEYNPNEESIVIYKKINNYNFHLVNKQRDINFSELEISTECENKLKDFYQIDNDLNLLVFKVDIKTEGSLITQVEYSFYNPDPQKIYEKLDLYKCSSNETKRILKSSDDNGLKLDETNILYPIELNNQQRQNIRELKNNKIFLFNDNEPFYNDVCVKFTTSQKTDIYIDDRRKKYYISERVCSPNCKVIDYIVETDKIKCLCSIKYEHQLPEEISDNNQPFNKKVLAPNLQSLKCPKQAFGTSKNFGLIFTLILGLAFLMLSFHRKICGLKKVFSSFQSLFEKNLKEEEEKEPLIEDEPEHLYKKDKKCPEQAPDLIDEENDEFQEQYSDPSDEKNNKLKKEDVTSKDGTVLIKRSIKNSKIKKDEDTSNINEEKGSKMKVEIKETGIKGSIINLNKNVQKEENNNEDHKDSEDNNSNLIDLSRTNDEYGSKRSENEKGEGVSEVITKKMKKRKRSRSKKNLKKDSNVNSSDENSDEDEKESKKRKKSKSKSKKKKKNLIDEESNENDNEINKGKKKEEKKDIETSSIYTEGAKRKKEQNNENYDKDIEKDKEKDLLDVNDIMNKSDISSITNNNNIIKNESNKKVNDLFDNNNDEDDEDMEYDLDLIDNDNDKEKKSEKNNIDNKPSKKRKKKKKKGKNPANPPKSRRNDELISVKSSNSKKDDTTFNSDKKEIKENIINVQNINNRLNNSDRLLIRNSNNSIEEEKNNIDYVLDNLNYENSVKKDKRSLVKMFWSLIKNNNTIFYIVFCDFNDLFAKGSVLILSLSFYLFINIILMVDSSLLHLYVGKDKSLKEKFEGGSFAINIFIPFLAYILTSFVKQKVSLNQFIYDKLYQYRELCKQLEKKKKEDKNKIILKMHDIKTDVSKFKNEVDYNTSYITMAGGIFLIINWYVCTCFCGIYENSTLCLVTNTLMSMIFTFIITIILYIASSVLRYISIKEKKITLFSLSTLLNPSYVMYANKYNQEKDKKEKREPDNEKENNLL